MALMLLMNMGRDGTGRDEQVFLRRRNTFEDQQTAWIGGQTISNVGYFERKGIPYFPQAAREYLIVDNAAFGIKISLGGIEHLLQYYLGGKFFLA